MFNFELNHGSIFCIIRKRIPTFPKNLSVPWDVGNGVLVGTHIRLNPWPRNNQRRPASRTVKTFEPHEPEHSIPTFCSGREFQLRRLLAKLSIQEPGRGIEPRQFLDRNLLDREASSHFTAELRILENLESHAHIVEFLGSFRMLTSVGPPDSIIMEYCKEGNLKEFLNRQITAVSTALACSNDSMILDNPPFSDLFSFYKSCCHRRNVLPHRI